MAKKKITTLLSLLVLPSISSVLNYRQASVEQEILTNNNENNVKINGEINKNITTQKSKIELFLDEDNDDSTEFTVSQCLDYFISKLDLNKIIRINEYCFNRLNKYDLNDNLTLEHNGLNLKCFLDVSVRTELLFDNLHEQAKRTLCCLPRRIILKDLTFIHVEHEFIFEKSNGIASSRQVLVYKMR